MKLVSIDGEREVLGRNAAVKLMLAMETCPNCGLVPAKHNDETCEWRYEAEIQTEEQWLP
jgi:ribosomal protein S27AE